MDDLLSGLSQFLSTPQGQEQLRAVEQMLSPHAPDAGEDTSSPQSGGIDPNLLALAGQLGEAMQRENDSVRLLQALLPLLGEKRQKKARQAALLLRVMDFLPQLKKSGLWEGLFDGD